MTEKEIVAAMSNEQIAAMTDEEKAPLLTALRVQIASVEKVQVARFYAGLPPPPGNEWKELADQIGRLGGWDHD